MAPIVRLHSCDGPDPDVHEETNATPAPAVAAARLLDEP